MKKILFALLLLGIASTPALSNDDNKGLESFNKIDANKDGKISWEEFTAAHPQMTRQAFDTIDLDKNSYIKSDEWLKFIKEHQRNMKEDKMGGKPGTAHPEGKPMIMPPKK